MVLPDYLDEEAAELRELEWEAMKIPIPPRSSLTWKNKV
jgi:hypothetical protein